MSTTTTTPGEQLSQAPDVGLRRAGIARALVFWVAGAAPVGAIPLHVLGVMPIDQTARFIVLPLAIAAAVLAMTGTHEAVWARRGALAGLVAVFAYDALRLPMVWMHLWPDFIPALGGWVTGSDDANPFIGYAWRYFGDGAGIAMAYFTVCGAVRLIRPGLVGAKPVALSIGYGIFIWLGLIATVVFTPTGGVILFHLTGMNFVLSLLGHLIYGSVLGLFLGHFTAGAGASLFSGHHLMSKAAALKGWAAAHVPLTAVGGLAATATALVAVYGATQLQAHHPSTDVGSPAVQQHATGATLPEDGRPHAVRRQHPKPSAHAPVVQPALLIAETPSAQPTEPIVASPTAGSSEPTAVPTTMPTSDPPSPPTSTPPAPIAFTSTPPPDPKFGETYQLSASGGSDAIAFSVDPSTTNAGTPHAACSIDGTTVTFDHAGTCVISADASEGLAARPTQGTTQRIVVARETAPISFEPGLPEHALAGETYAFTATGAPSDEPVRVSTSDQHVCTVNGGRMSFLAPGSCVITATQPQSLDYEGVAYTGTVDIAPAPVEADLGVIAEPGDRVTGSSLAPVTATVTGIPTGSSAVLTATADGPLEFRPDGDAHDACSLQKSDGDSTVWTCQVTSTRAVLGFVVYIEQGRDVSFEVAPVAPLTDPDLHNNVVPVHWDADRLGRVTPSDSAAALAPDRRYASTRRRTAHAR